MCDKCEAVVINGTLCHEAGCPNAWKDTTRLCKWCGEEFLPEEKKSNLLHGGLFEMFTVITPSGKEKSFEGSITLEDAQKEIGGYIEVIHKSDFSLLVDEDGKLKSLKPNVKASKLAEIPIVGTAIKLDSKSWWGWR